MYTPLITGVDVDRVAERRIVYVSFTQNETVIQKQFSFRITDPLETIKKTIRSFKQELEAGELLSVPIGAIDVTETLTVPVAPTQAELDKTAWDSAWAKLQIVDKLIAAQVLTGLEPAVAALRKKVKDDFKVTYLG